MKSAFDQIDLSRTPRHVAVIMDGNGRWAKNQGIDLTRVEGYFKADHVVSSKADFTREMKDEFLDAGALPTLHDRYGISSQ